MNSKMLEQIEESIKGLEQENEMLERENEYSEESIERWSDIQLNIEIDMQMIENIMIKLQEKKIFTKEFTLSSIKWNSLAFIVGLTLTGNLMTSVLFACISQFGLLIKDELDRIQLSEFDMEELKEEFSSLERSYQLEEERIRKEMEKVEEKDNQIQENKQKIVEYKTRLRLLEGKYSSTSLKNDLSNRTESPKIYQKTKTSGFKI